jgi:hypothetical protein
MMNEREDAAVDPINEQPDELKGRGVYSILF